MPEDQDVPPWHSACPKGFSRSKKQTGMITIVREFALSSQTTLAYEECLDFLRRSLSEEGFRIIAEVPFHREFERQVGLGWQKYTVLIVWNAFLAYQALLSDRDAGIFMPFHIVVGDNGQSTQVTATNHALFGRTIGNLGAQLVFRDLDRNIRSVFSKLSAREKAATRASA